MTKRISGILGTQTFQTLMSYIHRTELTILIKKKLFNFTVLAIRGKEKLWDKVPLYCKLCIPWEIAGYENDDRRYDKFTPRVIKVKEVKLPLEEDVNQVTRAEKYILYS